MILLSHIFIYFLILVLYKKLIHVTCHCITGDRKIIKIVFIIV